MNPVRIVKQFGGQLKNEGLIAIYISRSSRSPSHFRAKIAAAILQTVFLENGSEFDRKLYICEILLAEIFLSVPTLWGLSPLLMDPWNR